MSVRLWERCPDVLAIIDRYNIAADGVERDRSECNAILAEYDRHVDACPICSGMAQ